MAFCLPGCRNSVADDRPALSATMQRSEIGLAIEYLKPDAHTTKIAFSANSSASAGLGMFSDQSIMAP